MDRRRPTAATRCSARYLITAAGALSATNVPDFKGLDSFKGTWHHTSRWPKEQVDFTGKRVGVIGTGSTGIQIIPVIAQEAEHLYVFQRTPNYTSPRAINRLDARQMRARVEGELRGAPRRRASTPHMAATMRRLPPTRSALEVSEEERNRIYEQGWARSAYALLRSFTDTSTNARPTRPWRSSSAARSARRCKDPEVAELLCPKDHPLGTKRICLDTHYYETFNRDNVTLVDVRTNPIEEITARGPSHHGSDYELDLLVFATGFDALTGPLLRMGIVGRGGLALARSGGAAPHLPRPADGGLPEPVHDHRPRQPSVISHMPTSIEQHVDWIADASATCERQGLERIEATPEAEDAWVEHVNEVADRTLFKFADSWYLGANIPGKPRVFMPYVGGVGTYRRKCEEVAANRYEGFVLS